MHKSKDDRLGKRKKDIPVEFQDHFVASDWIDRRTKGGLQYVTKSFYRDVKLWEHAFRKFHEDAYDGLSREPGVIKNFTEELKKNFGHYDENTLKSFAFVRTMARLKTLQRNLAGTGETFRSVTKRIEYSY